jgi:xylulokinase
LNGTQVTDAFASLLGVDLAELASLALAQPVDVTDRPVLSAFLGGERSPNLPYARGLLGGLSLDTTRGQLARAAFEGVLLGLLAGADVLNGAGLDLSGRLMVTGGGSRSSAYVQLLADLSEREVTVLDLPDATVRGAAVQATAVLTGRSLTDVLADWKAPPARHVEPRHGANPNPVRSRYAELSAWPGHHRPWKEKA